MSTSTEFAGLKLCDAVHIQAHALPRRSKKSPGEPGLFRLHIKAKSSEKCLIGKQLEGAYQPYRWCKPTQRYRRLLIQS